MSGWFWILVFVTICEYTYIVAKRKLVKQIFAYIFIAILIGKSEIYIHIYFFPLFRSGNLQSPATSFNTYKRQLVEDQENSDDDIIVSSSKKQRTRNLQMSRKEGMAYLHKEWGHMYRKWCVAYTNFHPPFKRISQPCWAIKTTTNGLWCIIPHLPTNVKWDEKCNLQKYLWLAYVFLHMSVCWLSSFQQLIDSYSLLML